MLSESSDVTRLAHDGAGFCHKGWAVQELATPAFSPHLLPKQERRETEAFLPQWLAFDCSRKDWSLILNCVSLDSGVAKHQTNRERAWKDKMRSCRGSTVEHQSSYILAQL